MITDLEYLKDDASFLQCSACGRKSWGGEVNSTCGMRQPNGLSCSGIMRGKEATDGSLVGMSDNAVSK